MRKTALLVLAAALCVPVFSTAAPVLTAGFSPSDGRPALEVVLGAINNARQSIDVAAYSFTSKPVATALAGAKRRGRARGGRRKGQQRPLHRRDVSDKPGRAGAP